MQIAYDQEDKKNIDDSLIAEETKEPRKKCAEEKLFAQKKSPSKTRDT